MYSPSSVTLSSRLQRIVKVSSSADELMPGGFQHIQDVWEVADVVYASSCHSWVICLHPLSKVILFSLIDLFWGGLWAQNWMICFPHLLQSALFGFICALRLCAVWTELHLEEEKCFDFRGWWESVSLPGAWWEHTSGRRFFVQRSQNLEEHKQQIPRNPLWETRSPRGALLSSIISITYIPVIAPRCQHITGHICEFQ